MHTCRCSRNRLHKGEESTRGRVMCAPPGGYCMITPTPSTPRCSGRREESDMKRFRAAASKLLGIPAGMWVCGGRAHGGMGCGGEANAKGARHKTTGGRLLGNAAQGCGAAAALSPQVASPFFCCALGTIDGGIGKGGGTDRHKTETETTTFQGAQAEGGSQRCSDWCQRVDGASAEALIAHRPPLKTSTATGPQQLSHGEWFWQPPRGVWQMPMAIK